MASRTFYEMVLFAAVDLWPHFDARADALGRFVSILTAIAVELLLFNKLNIFHVFSEIWRQ